jgi:hypothetical protein
MKKKLQEEESRKGKLRGEKYKSEMCGKDEARKQALLQEKGREGKRVENFEEGLRQAGREEKEKEEKKEKRKEKKLENSTRNETRIGKGSVKGKGNENESRNRQSHGKVREEIRLRKNRGGNEPLKAKSPSSFRRSLLRDTLFLIIILAAALALLTFYPEKRSLVTTVSWKFFVELILILPAVMVLMGLFAVFVSREMVVKYLGKSSGVKGFLLAIFLGALPTGPLYVAFPLAAALIKKGARRANIVIFLSAWACIKIPQEMVELQFLGLKFMATRLALIIIFVILMGLTIERIIDWTDRRQVENKGT